ncbi:MAG: hypothetical protein LH616_02765 [Ilumatobacteraceae bacterium]|nr:hypothetical protein [Ilumatobacteraceae bacterium]
MHFRIIAMSVALAALTACGGDSEDAPSSPPPSPPPFPPTAGGDLGERAVPGCLLQASLDQPATPGANRTLRIVFIAEPGAASLETLSAAITTMPHPTTLIPGTPLAGSPGTWTWPMTLPPDLINQRIVVRTQDTAGNVCQSGIDDFVLAAFRE